MQRLTQRILDGVRAGRAEMAEFTKALVAIPTENPPGRAYRACVEAIAGKLDELGLPCAIEKIPGRAADLGAKHTEDTEAFPRYWLRSVYGQGRRALYFHGHYDVVPASSEAQFRPRIENGHLFGRGAADMKGGLVGMLCAVKALKEIGVELNGRVEIVCVPDEETGGAIGTRYLADSGALGQDGIGMLTPEPTGGVVWNACRGAISLRVRLKGKPAHVGLAWRGVNAFEHMVQAANALLGYKKKIEARKTAFNITPDAARSSVLLLGGRCEGGTNFNLVPAECSFTVDRRLNPEEDFHAEKEELFAIFERLRQDGIDLEVETLQEGRSTGTFAEHPVARALAHSVGEVTGKPPAFEMCPGLLEIRFYAERGMPAFAYGPGRLEVSHGPSEFVALQHVESCAAIYALTAARLLSGEL